MRYSLQPYAPLLLVLLVLPVPASGEGSEETHIRSMHAGLLYPNGVDIFGYTVEDRLYGNVYSYYTFGFPALAAAGISYYPSGFGNGWMASIGTGIGYLNQGNFSVSYQWQVGQGKEPLFLKLGIGYFGSLIANGAFPVLSVERPLE